MRWTLALPVLLLVAACSRFDAGLTAFDDGRFEDAHEVFVALDDESDDASPELLHNRALAALRAGDVDDAAQSAERLAQADDAQLAGLGHFLLGNVAHERASRAAKQARAVEAEPFAFEIAVRHAESAALAWCRAAATRDAWPAAARNAERALRLAEVLRKEQREAELRRERKTAGGATPRVRPVPVDTSAAAAPPEDDSGNPSKPTPPSPDPGAEGDPSGTAGMTDTRLSPEQVAGLLDRLAAREREKRDVRTERRKSTQQGVERDW